MKTPLEIEHNNYGEFVGVFDADGKRHSQSTLVDYINSHAAQPGPPREDGVYIVQLASGEELIVQRDEGANFVGRLAALPDSRIVMHRKHSPLEVPHG